MDIHPLMLKSLVLDVLGKREKRKFKGGELPADALDTVSERVYKHAHTQHTEWLKARAQLSSEGKLPVESDPDQRTPDEAALDALTHHVFNSLRGHHDEVNGATFEDVRAIVAQTR